MQAQLTTPFVLQIQAASQVLVGPYVFYQGLKRFVNKAILVIFAIVIIPLFIPIFGFLMLYIRIQLSRAVNSKIDINFENYKQTRRELDALNKIHHKIFTNIPIDLVNNKNFIVSLFQIKAIDRILQKRIDALSDALKSLNPQLTKSDYLLTPLSEDDLWRNRTKAYDYLM